MKGRYLAENLYKSRIVNPIVAISSGGNPLDEYEILCEVAPKYDKGWVFVDFDSTDTSKRDLIFFHRKEDKTIYYYRKNRDLLNNGAKSVKHEDGATIQMNDVSEWINNLSKNIEDFGYVEQKYDKDTDVLVYGGKIDIFGTVSNIADTKLSIPLSTDGKFYIFFDYADKIFHIYNDNEKVEHSGIVLSEVTITNSEIVSIEDVRATQLSTSFSSKMFDVDNGNMVIKDGAITIEKLDEDLQEKVKKAHSHENKDVIDRFEVKGGDLRWGELNLATIGEANTASNVGTGVGLFKEKYGPDLKFKSIIGGAGISVVEQGDTINIMGGMVTETQTDEFSGDGAQKVFVLTKEIYNTGLVWITTIGGTSLVYNVDFTVADDMKTITFVEAPTKQFFVNYIIKSDLGVQSIGEANTASNNTATTGFGVFKEKSGIDLIFNRLKAGDNISLSQSFDGTISISATGGQGGGHSTRGICGEPSGAVDGINKAFALPQEPIAADCLLVFKNGLLQKPIVDYTLEGYTINFIYAPVTGDEILYEMYTEITESMDRINIVADHSTINTDWETVPYYTLITNPKSGSTRLWVNGVFMSESKDYKIVDNNIYIKNVLVGDEIQLIYFYSLS